MTNAIAKKVHDLEEKVTKLEAELDKEINGRSARATQAIKLFCEDCPITKPADCMSCSLNEYKEG